MVSNHMTMDYPVEIRITAKRHRIATAAFSYQMKFNENLHFALITTPNLFLSSSLSFTYAHFVR